VDLKKKRHIASWVLLAVFVPMLLLSSVHIHNRGQVAAVSHPCVHHHCGGHLGQSTNTMDTCVLCQFLSLQFVAVAVATVVLYNKIKKITYAQRERVFHFDVCGIPTLRAPPSV